MSNDHTQHAGKDSLEAMHENDAHSAGTNDAVPGGAHAHSPAAHESGPKAHTKPVGDQRALADKEESIREVSAVKKDRGQ
jgi:hypothetical protein